MSKDLDGAREWANACLSDIPQNDYRTIYLGWLRASMAVPARNERIGIGLKALVEPFLQQHRACSATLAPKTSANSRSVNWMRPTV